MLFSETELRSLLGGYRMIDIREGEQKLSEGVYHRGTGWVLQAVAEKVMQ
jgi:hypothetical protein